MGKRETKRLLRQAIIEDVRSNFENWPQYLHEFEGELTSEEIRAEAERLFRRMEMP